MPCYNPVPAYRSIKQKSPNGKSVIEFKAENSKSGDYEKITVPCGQCIGCRLGRSKEWALRCMHEAQQFTNNCVLTLTINNDYIENKHQDCTHCPIFKRHGNRCGPGSLCKKEFQDFMKRLRKRFDGMEPVYADTEKGTKVHYPIRFFQCGEYGDKLGRPHFHACIFNFDFTDKYFWKKSKSGTRLYRSPILEELWTIGNCEIGELTWEAAAYIARYCTKKVNGDRSAEHYLELDESTGELYYLEPEYITMSRRPGIGYTWLTENSGDCYPKDFLTHKGLKYKIPGFYDRKTEECDPDLIARMKMTRRIKACKNPKTGVDLNREHRVKQKHAEKLIRSYENDPSHVQRIRHQEQNLPPTSVLPQRGPRNKNVQATILENWLRNARLSQ